ncbi:MAG: hypothetical protein ACD_39C01829G0003 [uncultured bacterium]|nr:MAG: hypothetical protein ACD_39C01829G0003 [uncultured bacterium]
MIRQDGKQQHNQKHYCQCDIKPCICRKKTDFTVLHCTKTSYITRYEISYQLIACDFMDALETAPQLIGMWLQFGGQRSIFAHYTPGIDVTKHDLMISFNCKILQTAITFKHLMIKENTQPIIVINVKPYQRGLFRGISAQQIEIPPGKTLMVIAREKMLTKNIAQVLQNRLRHLIGAILPVAHKIQLCKSFAPVSWDFLPVKIAVVNAPVFAPDQISTTKLMLRQKLLNGLFQLITTGILVINRSNTVAKILFGSGNITHAFENLIGVGFKSPEFQLTAK